jgi:uncharacterized protein
MPAKFVLTRNAAGRFRFDLRSSNGRVLASGETYKTKAAALNGIKSIRKGAADASFDDQTVATKPALASVADAAKPVKAAAENVAEGIAGLFREKPTPGKKPAKKPAKKRPARKASKATTPRKRAAKKR